MLSKLFSPSSASRLLPGLAFLGPLAFVMDALMHTDPHTRPQLLDKKLNATKSAFLVQRPQAVEGLPLRGVPDPGPYETECVFKKRPGKDEGLEMAKAYNLLLRGATSTSATATGNDRDAERLAFCTKFIRRMCGRIVICQERIDFLSNDAALRLLAGKPEEHSIASMVASLRGVPRIGGLPIHFTFGGPGCRKTSTAVQVVMEMPGQTVFMAASNVPTDVSALSFFHEMQQCRRLDKMILRLHSPQTESFVFELLYKHRLKGRMRDGTLKERYTLDLRLTDQLELDCLLENELSLLRKLADWHAQAYSALLLVSKADMESFVQRVKEQMATHLKENPTTLVSLERFTSWLADPSRYDSSIGGLSFAEDPLSLEYVAAKLLKSGLLEKDERFRYKELSLACVTLYMLGLYELNGPQYAKLANCKEDLVVRRRWRDVVIVARRHDC